MVLFLNYNYIYNTSFIFSLITQNTLYGRRDMFLADDKKYLQWYSYEAIVSSVFHSCILLTLIGLYTYEDHQLFVNLNDCAKNSLEDKFPYICLAIICMAILHLIFTLIYVTYFPHVWNLDPKRVNKDNVTEEELEEVLKSNNVHTDTKVNSPCLDSTPLDYN